MGRPGVVVADLAGQLGHTSVHTSYAVPIDKIEAKANQDLAFPIQRRNTLRGYEITPVVTPK